MRLIKTLLVALAVIQVYSQTLKQPSKSKQINNKIFKCEIEDLKPDRPIVDMNGYKFDSWVLLPETPMILPLPKKFHVMKQIQRVVAWQYKLSRDREFYKEEYMSLINDPDQWIKFVIDNLNILDNGAKMAMDNAVENGDTKGLENAIELYRISAGYRLNYLAWTWSVNPEKAKFLAKEGAKQ